MSEENGGADLSDAEVIERAKTDPEAFGLLYERFVARIYNYVYYRVGNRHDAEDITARTFQRALANVRTFESRGVPISAWFYRIAHNLVANFHRDRSRRQTISLESLVSQRADVESPSAAAERGERAQALLRAIRELPEDRQQLVILKFNEHLSNAEIGEVLGRSESAIKSLYHRTLLALRKSLEEQGFFSEDGD
ncbi:MAG: sigma-70 family RNA polymerase sigma factor [Anaerolineae bacterium]|nr:sigma-70 family RNA polymerase sigma factor [Anaerolineae bacterium]